MPLYSQIQVVAEEISKFVGEPEKFALYAGIIRRIGIGRAYWIFSEVKDACLTGKAKTPAKLFMYLSRKP